MRESGKAVRKKKERGKAAREMRKCGKALGKAIENGDRGIFGWQKRINLR